MPTRRSVLIAVGAGATVVGMAGLFFALTKTGRPDGASLLALTLPDLAGKPVALDQWRGKVMVVNFWATWCPPCRDEMPDFIRAQADYGSRGLQVVGIGIDEIGKLRRFAADMGLNYPQLVGGDATLEFARALGNPTRGLPFTVIVDRGGAIVHTQVGRVSARQLNATVNKLL